MAAEMVKRRAADAVQVEAWRALPLTARAGLARVHETPGEPCLGPCTSRSGCALVLLWAMVVSGWSWALGRRGEVR